MKKISRAIVVLLALGAGALVFGFVLFAANVTRDEVSGWDKADGIVVLTGGDNRLEAGAKLLSEHRAKRMLISGVNRKVTARGNATLARPRCADVQLLRRSRI